MSARLPIVYALLLVIEASWLTWRYATDPPAPSSLLGQALGWGAIASMTLLLVYSVARRWRALRNFARLSYWLHFHIFLAVQGVMWAVFHSSHVFARAHVAWLNPGLLSLVATLVVFSSGLVGRYLYGWLPRAIGGEQLTGAAAEAALAGFVPARRAAALRVQRVFSWWIVLHRPLAAMLYVLAAMHILLSYMFSPGLK